MIEEIGKLATVSAYQVVWTRYGVHLVALGIIVARRPGIMVKTRRPLLQAGCSLSMLAMPAGFIMAARAGSIEAIHGVFWLSPILALVVASCAGERVGGRLWLLSFCGWGSALLLTTARPPTAIGAVAGALVMAGSFAFYLVGMRRLAGESAASKLFYTAAGVFLFLSFAVSRFYRPPDPSSWSAMLAIGLLGLVALFAFDRALELVPAAAVAPVLFIQPAFSFALSLLRTGHPVGLGVRIGLVLQVCLLVLLLAGLTMAEAPASGESP
jgi:drug/metabolite transporter (DMT)-like permease